MNNFDRRTFLKTTAAVSATGLFSIQPVFATGKTVEQTPFADLVELSKGVWAVVSKPFNEDGSFNQQSLPTLCNGGLIEGADRVVAIEGFFQPQGSAWLSEKAMQLTGKPVTDVIVSHFHADHSGGLAGYQRRAEGPEIIATDVTRRLIYERYSKPNPKEGSPFGASNIRPVLPTQIITDDKTSVTMDLGNRQLVLDSMKGHTPSDLAVTIQDEGIVFAGDLVWWGIFHNYVDATPSKLRQSASRLLRNKDHMIVTGHGQIGLAKEMGDYLDLLDLVEEKAKQSHARGQTVEEGAKNFEIPGSLGTWRVFGPNYYEVAFTAWYRELNA